MVERRSTTHLTACPCWTKPERITRPTAGLPLAPSDTSSSVYWLAPPFQAACHPAELWTPDLLYNHHVTSTAYHVPCTMSCTCCTFTACIAPTYAACPCTNHDGSLIVLHVELLPRVDLS
jgi:hypothetical protein